MTKGSTVKPASPSQPSMRPMIVGSCGSRVQITGGAGGAQPGQEADRGLDVDVGHVAEHAARQHQVGGHGAGVGVGHAGVGLDHLDAVEPRRPGALAGGGHVRRQQLDEPAGHVGPAAVAGGGAEDVVALAGAQADHADRPGRRPVEGLVDEVAHDEQSQVQRRPRPVVVVVPGGVVAQRHAATLARPGVGAGVTHSGVIPTTPSAATLAVVSSRPGLRTRAAALAGPVARWWHDVRPDRREFRADALAGLPGAVASVPDGMASAVLAGVNPVYGLYASAAGPTAGGLATSTRLMVIATTGAAALAAGSALDGVDAGDKAGSLFLLTLIAGAGDGGRRARRPAGATRASCRTRS